MVKCHIDKEFKKESNSQPEDTMKRLFAPGCALMIYKPNLVETIHNYLKEQFGDVRLLLTCCHHTPQIPPDTQVINICPGCDRRYRENYENPSTISLWELLLETDSFKFPDYKSKPMTIIDACPTRDQDRIHNAVRALAHKMNISVVEPAKTKRNSTCCGDSFYGKIPTTQVITQMEKKASEMPIEDIIVYCVSCSQAMFIGGKHPRYLVDLLFFEETFPKTSDLDRWHKEIDEFIDSHKEIEQNAG
jgi:hypothetical protein